MFLFDDIGVKTPIEVFCQCFIESSYRIVFFFFGSRVVFRWPSGGPQGVQTRVSAGFNGIGKKYPDRGFLSRFRWKPGFGLQVALSGPRVNLNQMVQIRARARLDDIEYENLNLGFLSMFR